jgi:uncharacterized protein
MTDGGSVTIVTQTCVRPERADDFGRWQAETSTVVSRFPGFVEQQLLLPNPPLQVDWVILQTFERMEDAQRWLGSPERQQRIEEAASMLVGRDDVHLVRDRERRRTSSVSAVISTRVKPGRETEYRAWERRIAAAQSKARGLEGYRFEPAIPGVQEDCLAFLRFDSEANLNGWLASPERLKLLEEAQGFTEEFHARIVRTGFDHWFGTGRSAGDGGPAPWKMNMIVLLLLYPIVFLFSFYVQTPWIIQALGAPFSVALFCGNIVSTVSLAFLVPMVANRMGWWLRPESARARWSDAAGAVLVVILYAAMVALFTTFF